MTLHFSYGANMDRSGMARRCPGAKALGVATLDHHRFVITADGYASVVPASGAQVHGVLWRLTPRDLAALNAFESLDSGLYRSVTLPVRLGGRVLRGTVYVGRRSQGKARAGYLDQILAAARGWNLPRDYIAELQRWSSGSWRGRHPAETGAIA
jgi:gamma-glutamylcyclotransferase (GGCT)/AIG2-like uncharacterized protein YtfP